MDFDPYTSNAPLWGPAMDHPGQGHQEVWYMKMNAVEERRALWLRFTLLITKDGNVRVAEVWAIDFQRREDGSVDNCGIKNTWPLHEFTQEAGDVPAFRIGGNYFSDTHTHGRVEKEGQSIAWDLKLGEFRPAGIDLVPASVRRLGINNIALNLFDDLRFNGWSEVNGRRFEWHDAPGMQGHLFGPKNGHSWAWAHCNTFKDEDGNPADVLFDGIHARARLGDNFAAPALATMYFVYDGCEFRLNRLRDALRIRADHGKNIWRFTAKADNLSFRGRVYADDADFAGVTYQDTNGSFLYCYNSKLSSMTLEVWEKGKCINKYYAGGTVGFEVVTREKRNDIGLLI